MLNNFPSWTQDNYIGLSYAQKKWNSEGRVGFWLSAPMTTIW